MNATFVHYQSTDERMAAFRRMVSARKQWEQEMMQYISKRAQE